MNVFDIYRQWETDLRPYTVEALRRMTPEQLRYKPEGWHSSALELADHMAGWLVYHVMEHEIHHRGQIFMLMRMQGVTPPEI